MQKTNINRPTTLKFKQFSRKGYALFNCLGREVIVGTLAVATLSHAKAQGMSTQRDPQDSILVSSAARELDEVSVIGSRAPLTAQQAPKVVSVISREEIHRAAVTSVNDLLKLATGVDVRQRGGFGVQTDISINGGTFDQITILLNGVNISNPQTGHNAADFPVSLSDIERIEILEGAAARVFGASAFNGAINIVTRADKQSGLRLHAEGGSYGTFGADAGLTVTNSAWHNQLSGGYTQSDGAIKNSDFSRRRGFYQGAFRSTHLNLDWQAGLSSQHYGANTFYSAKYDNQWEQTSRVITSLAATIHNLPAQLVIQPTIYWQKAYDHYQLIRGEEGAAKGENYHDNNIYGASLNAHLSWLLGKTAVGADIRKEHIYSTAYGRQLPESEWKDIAGSDRKYEREGERTNTSLFVEHNVVLSHFTFSAGLLANRNTALDGDMRLYPGVDVAYRPTGALKIFASWNKALRVPTYTDMFTNNAVQQGDVSLKPERNTTLKAGVQLRQTGVEATLNGFYSRGRDMIDWVYESEESTKYHAMNIGRLNNMGFSLDTRWRLPQMLADSRFPITEVQIGYAYIHQDHDTDQPIFKSLYALEYLRHKFTAQVSHNIWSHLSAQWSLRWQQRMNGYHPYAKLDGKLLWDTPTYSLYVQADNLTSHRYYDLGGVLQPGFWIMAGGTWKIFK